MSASSSQPVESRTPAAQRRALPGATKRGTLVAVGLSMYVASFFLRAIGDLRGYFCADFALVYPLGAEGRSLFHERPVEYFSILGSGLINPLFLITFFLRLCEMRPFVITVLRTLTILMMPLCWVVFRYESFYPREGHVLWIAGMLLTLFAIADMKPRPPTEQRA